MSLPSCLIFCIAAVIHIGIVEAECPLGWHHYGESCYFFSSEAFSWFIAEISCQEHNKARLAEVETKAEADYLINMARQLGKSVSYWLGGRDDIIEGTWMWASTDSIVEATAWGPSEPNGKTSENCLCLYAPHNWLWNDNVCSSQIQYICEQK